MLDRPDKLLAVGCVFLPGSDPIVGGQVRTRLGVVAEWSARTVERPDVWMPDFALIPRPVNAHLHLDLSHAGLIPPTPGDPGAWLRAVIATRFASAPEEVRSAASREAQALSLGGTGLVGDVAALPTPPQFLEGVRFREVLGLTPERAEQTLGTASGSGLDGLLAPGVSPHAPYSTALDLFGRCAALGRPIATHLGEFAEERDLLESRAGPFRDFLEGLGLWHPDRLARSWAQILDAVRAAPSVAVVHGNYLRPGPDWPANASLVYCPRTHAAFGHPPHPVAEFLRAGIPVGLGTDSLASNPDLDVLAEVYYLREHRSDLSPKQLLEMLTAHGLACLGLAECSRGWLLIPWRSGHCDPHDGLFLGPVPDAGFEPVSGLVIRGGPA